MALDTPSGSTALHRTERDADRVSNIPQAEAGALSPRNRHQIRRPDIGTTSDEQFVSRPKLVEPAPRLVTQHDTMVVRPLELETATGDDPNRGVVADDVSIVDMLRALAVGNELRLTRDER